VVNGNVSGGCSVKVGDLVKLNPDVFKMDSHIGVVTKVIRAGSSVEVTWANLITESAFSHKLIKVSK
jgi:hypothetical protein